MTYTTYLVDENRMGPDVEYILYISDDNGYTWEYVDSYEFYADLQDEVRARGLVDINDV